MKTETIIGLVMTEIDRAEKLTPSGPPISSRPPQFPLKKLANC